MTGWKQIALGVIGVLVSMAIVWLGISWASGDVMLSQSVLFGGVVAILGLIRLAEAARQLFAATDADPSRRG